MIPHDVIPITWKRYDMDMLWIQQELEYDQTLFKNWINVLNIQELTKTQVTKPNSYRNPYYGIWTD